MNYLLLTFTINMYCLFYICQNLFKIRRGRRNNLSISKVNMLLQQQGLKEVPEVCRQDSFLSSTFDFKFGLFLKKTITHPVKRRPFYKIHIVSKLALLKLPLKN